MITVAELLRFRSDVSVDTTPLPIGMISTIEQQRELKCETYDNEKGWHTPRKANVNGVEHWWLSEVEIVGKSLLEIQHSFDNIIETGRFKYRIKVRHEPETLPCKNHLNAKVLHFTLVSLARFCLTEEQVILSKGW